MVRMVTGDNKITAMAIAKECGILTDDQTKLSPDCVMEGPEFFERMGGLWCKACKQKAPCSCDPNDADEGVKNL
jgi:P-type Ca2+ transporter type 2B